MNKSTVVAYSFPGRYLKRLGHLVALLLPAGLLAMSIFGALAHPAHAQATLSPKLAPDLASAVNAPVLPAANWAKQTGNGRFFKVIVVGAGVDPLLADLRNAVAAAGGAVNYRYQSIKGFSATIPAPALNLLAQRPDVDSISPNRPATKTASLLELATGAHAARSLAGLARSYDGKGVGIAILDSGIYAEHAAFLAADGATRRVAKMVDLTRGERLGQCRHTDVDDWPRPLGRITTPAARTSETARAGSTTRAAATADIYGHGTRRRVGGGRPRRRGHPRCARASRPGATLFDVRVLDSDRRRNDRRRARRDRLGDLSQQGIRHPRPESESRRRFDRVVPHRPACAAPRAPRSPQD